MVPIPLQIRCKNKRQYNMVLTFLAWDFFFNMNKPKAGSLPSQKRVHPKIQEPSSTRALSFLLDQTTIL